MKNDIPHSISQGRFPISCPTRKVISLLVNPISLFVVTLGRLANKETNFPIDESNFLFMVTLEED